MEDCEKEFVGETQQAVFCKKNRINKPYESSLNIPTENI